MLKESEICEIKKLKKQGVPNSEIMSKYNISYVELRQILDEVKR